MELLKGLSLAAPRARRASEGHQPPAATRTDRSIPRPAEPMALSDAKLDAFFAAAEEIRSSGALLGVDPTRPDELAREIGAARDADATGRKHGLAGAEELQRVAYNASLAYGALVNGGTEALRRRIEKVKVDQARTLSKMRQGSSSREQLERIAGQMRAGVAIFERMRDVPDGNPERMEKYRERLIDLGAP